jgi:hypothetical protein
VLAASASPCGEQGSVRRIFGAAAGARGRKPRACDVGVKSRDASSESCELLKSPSGESRFASASFSCHPTSVRAGSAKSTVVLLHRVLERLGVIATPEKLLAEFAWVAEPSRVASVWRRWRATRVVTAGLWLRVISLIDELCARAAMSACTPLSDALLALKISVSRC